MARLWQEIVINAEFYLVVLESLAEIHLSYVILNLHRGDGRRCEELEIIDRIWLVYLHCQYFAILEQSLVKLSVPHLHMDVS